MALVAIALIAPAAARAAPAWLAPHDLSVPAGQAYSGFAPRVALDPHGNAVAIWTRHDGSKEIVQAATRSAGSDWSQPQDLSAIGGGARYPQVALDAQGNAVAIWTRHDGSKEIVQAATRPAAGGPVRDGWGPPQNLSPAGPDGPQLALDHRGNAVAVWTSNQIVQAAARPAGGSWGEPHAVSAAGELAFEPRVALDPQGNAVVVWIRIDGGRAHAAAATRPAGGDWGEPQNVSPERSTASRSPQVFEPQVALDPEGTAVAVWVSSIAGLGVESGLPVDGVIQAAIRPAGDSWKDAENLSSATGNGVSPQLALDPHGNAVAVWTNVISTRSNQIIQAAARQAGGGWSAPRDVSSVVGNADRPQVALDPKGNAVAVWQRFSSTNFTIEAARRPAGGDWDEPTTISGAELVDTSISAPDNPPLPEVAMDSEGNAATIWRRVGDAGVVFKAAAYDAAGPQLRDLAVPPSGTAGLPLAVSVSPVDVWSQVASTDWNFGDGATASGSSVSHTYARPGTYGVTVTSTDSLENSSSERRTVVVAAAGGGGPGGGGPGGGGPAGPPGSGAPSTGAGSGGAGSGGAGDAAARGSRAQARRLRGLRRCHARVRRHSGRERRRARRGSFLTRARRRAHMRRHARGLRRRCRARWGRTPGRVRGLRARALSRTKVRLSFIAAGTHGNRPPAAHTYLVKQSTRPIRGARGFRRARSLCRGRCRLRVGRVGRRVSLTVTGLRPRTTYRYAIAARDNVSRRLGRRSRSVRARTR